MYLMLTQIAHFQLGASNFEKDKYLKKRRNNFWTNMKLCNLRFEKIKIWEGAVSHKKAIKKYYYLKF